MKCFNCDEPAEFMLRVKEHDENRELKRWQCYDELSFCPGCEAKALEALDSQNDGKRPTGIQKIKMPTNLTQWAAATRPQQWAEMRKAKQERSRLSLIQRPTDEEIDAVMSSRVEPVLPTPDPEVEAEAEV